MLVAFRADASVQIGTGHVMRCLTLAEELKGRGHQCLFICRDHEGHLGDLIRDRGFELYLLANGDGPVSNTSSAESSLYADWLGVFWETDAQETLEQLRSREVRWIVVDHYGLDACWEREVCKHGGQIMVIDDLAERVHDCELLLDQNLGRSDKDYDGLVPEHTLRLIGPEYSLLRPEFAQIREKCLKRRQSMRCRRILISMGGVDSTNVTGKVLSALAGCTLARSTELDIVMGASAPALEEVRRQAATLPFEATVSVNVSNMAERMCMADLSIGAAGSTSWERCCLGLPSIMIILAENQRSIGEALARAECATLLDEPGITNELGPLVEQFVESTSELERLALNAARICDGRGAIRAASKMIGEVSD